MTIPELYEKLNSPSFMDPKDGDLFYNYYIYQYPAEKEYEIRQEIIDFKANLIRPSTYVDVLTLNLFDEFCKYLDQTKFLKNPSMLQFLLDKEKKKPESAANVESTLSRTANSEGFIRYIHQRIMEHKAKDDHYKRPYVFVNGVGGMYPYLRVNNFLTLYENFNKTDEYKILVFYPGHHENNSYKLFGVLPDNHTYRATLLVNQD